MLWIIVKSITLLLTNIVFMPSTIIINVKNEKNIKTGLARKMLPPFKEPYIAPSVEAITPKLWLSLSPECTYTGIKWENNWYKHKEKYRAPNIKIFLKLKSFLLEIRKSINRDIISNNVR